MGHLQFCRGNSPVAVGPNRSVMIIGERQRVISKENWVSNPAGYPVAFRRLQSELGPKHKEQ